MVIPVSEPWPPSASELVAFQHRLAADAERVRDEEPWTPGGSPRIGGCFVAFARGEAGPGRPGDRAWAAAVVWAPSREDEPPDLDMRGASTPVGGRDVTAVWLCTRSRACPVLVHPGWRTSADTAVEIVLAASTNAARSPVPLQEARRVAREGRAIAGAG